VLGLTRRAQQPWCRSATNRYSTSAGQLWKDRSAHREQHQVRHHCDDVRSARLKTLMKLNLSHPDANSMQLGLDELRDLGIH
jgi:hypothetical protein